MAIQKCLSRPPFLHCIPPCTQKAFCVALLSFFTLKNAMERSMWSSTAHVSCKVAQFWIQLEYLITLLLNINPTHKYFLIFSNPWFYPTHINLSISLLILNSKPQFSTFKSKSFVSYNEVSSKLIFVIYKKIAQHVWECFEGVYVCVCISSLSWVDIDCV
jgi:hypothetical protein